MGFALSSEGSPEMKPSKDEFSPEEPTSSPVVAKKPHGNKGKKRTPEQRAKHRAAMRARWESPEYRAKMSLARIGKKHKPHKPQSNKGRPLSPEHRAALFSPEHRANLSRAHKGKPLSPEHRSAISRGIKRAAISRTSADSGQSQSEDPRELGTSQIIQESFPAPSR
jgi:hypothetical protein